MEKRTSVWGLRVRTCCWFCCWLPDQLWPEPPPAAAEAPLPAPPEALLLLLKYPLELGLSLVLPETLPSM